MNETLLKILEKAISLAEQTGEFIVEQSPLVLQEFFMWHTATAIMGIVLGLFILFLGIFIPKLWRERPDENGDYLNTSKFLGSHYDEGLDILTIFVTAIFFIISIGVIIKKVYLLVYILVAPKLYLIEYFLDAAKEIPACK